MNKTLHNWAADVLRLDGVEFDAIQSAYVTLENNYCIGHDGDYCECDLSPWISLGIHYSKRGSGRSYTSRDFYDLDAFLSEFCERAQR